MFGGVTMKLKGVEFYNSSQEPFLQNCQGSTGAQVYDPADYVVPPQVRIRWFAAVGLSNKQKTTTFSFLFPGTKQLFCNDQYVGHVRSELRILWGGP